MKKLQTIERFKYLKILVVGEAMLDVYINGQSDRLCREAPALIFNVKEKYCRCGGAANVAVNIARLGAQASFLSVVGTDAAGAQLIRCLEKENVQTSQVIRDQSRITLTKKRMATSSSLLMRIDEGTIAPIDRKLENEIIKRTGRLAASADAIIISDYGYGILTERLVKSISKEIARFAYKIIVDAKKPERYKSLCPAAIKPNYQEALGILNEPACSGSSRVAQILKKEKDLFRLTGASMIAVTLDTEGLVFLEKAKRPHHICCHPSADTKAIGAGDTFTSAFTLSLASGSSGQQAAEIAAAAAAIVVQKDGTSPCSFLELRNYFKPLPKYITGNEELENIIKELRHNQRKIVFTNGCFDIIQSGHINLLDKAAQAGDVLIVGVNGDKSIYRIKGKGRPINNLLERLTILSGLQSVDYLVSFDEEGPGELLKIIRPDVFVKGGNYTEQNIPEAQLLKTLQCRIRIIPFEEDRSDEDVMKKISQLLQEEMHRSPSAQVPKEIHPR